MRTFHVNVAELVAEVRLREEWAASEIARRQVRLDALAPHSSERDRLRTEIGLYAAISAKLGSLRELATGQEPGAARQCRPREQALSVGGE